jgi:hypothetical protein
MRAYPPEPEDHGDFAIGCRLGMAYVFRAMLADAGTTRTDLTDLACAFAAVSAAPDA